MDAKQISDSAKNMPQAAEYVEKPESQLKVMWETLRQNKAAVVGLVIIGCLVLIALTVWLSQLIGKQILPYDPNASDMTKSFIKPNAQHWFGTDQLGRDLLSRILDGTKISLFVGVAAVAISLTIGIILGAIAGYRGGKTDTVIMRFMDMMLAIPSILLAIAFMAALGKGLDKAVFAIGLVSIPEYARIVRGSILSVKEHDYVQAAKVIGNRSSRIIFKHILPNVISV
ncbi:MAG TPA: ABC transporter permease, partial [Verrucomicrobiae bacterium]|nr:ABC transporter permease [Verrucomicrobiae bacterium]